MNAIVIGLLGFVAGVLFSNTVRTAIQPMLPEGMNIPSFYASYPANLDYTSRSSFTGSVDASEYDSASERYNNHIPIE